MSRKEQLAFRQGYYLAVATIVRTHGEGRIAEDVLREFGRVNLTGIDDCDIQVLKPLANEIARREKSMDALALRNRKGGRNEQQ